MSDLPEEVQKSLRSSLEYAFDEKYAFEHIDENSADYDAWYSEKVQIEDATNLEEFLECFHCHLDHIRKLDFDSIFDNEALKLIESGDRLAVQNAEKAFSDHYGADIDLSGG